LSRLYTLQTKIYGLLQVIYNEKGSKDRGVVGDLKKAQLI
jgi:hypothetical protein